MDSEILRKVQQRVSAIKVPFIKSLHSFSDIPDGFKPWESGLSPSALYNCSLSGRKSMKLKSPEVKWMSIKRWVTKTPEGIDLPDGVYLSIKRKEEFIAFPHAHFDKKEFILMMFPYGNVWSQSAPDVPITEQWLWSEVNNQLIFEALMLRDAARPIHGYFKSCYDYMVANPDQIGIHLKRKRRENATD
jgi:hypothetical protein